MPAKAPPVTESECDALRRTLTSLGLTHLTVTKRSPHLKIEASDAVGPYPVLRLRRETANLWTLEFPTSSNRWETTPYRAPIRELMQLVVDEFNWVLTDQQDPV